MDSTLTKFDSGNCIVEVQLPGAALRTVATRTRTTLSRAGCNLSTRAIDQCKSIVLSCFIKTIEASDYDLKRRVHFAG